MHNMAKCIKFKSDPQVPPNLSPLFGRARAHSRDGQAARKLNKLGPQHLSFRPIA